MSADAHGANRGFSLLHDCPRCGLVCVELKHARLRCPQCGLFLPEHEPLSADDYSEESDAEVWE